MKEEEKDKTDQKGNSNEEEHGNEREVEVPARQIKNDFAMLVSADHVQAPRDHRPRQPHAEVHIVVDSVRNYLPHVLAHGLAHHYRVFVVALQPRLELADQRQRRL